MINTNVNSFLDVMIDKLRQSQLNKFRAQTRTLQIFVLWDWEWDVIDCGCDMDSEQVPSDSTEQASKEIAKKLTVSYGHKLHV